jgi:hypothetical protein
MWYIFSSYVWKIDPNTNTSIIVYTYIHTEHVSKSGTVRGKEEKNDKGNNT